MPKINKEEYKKIKLLPYYDWNWIAREKTGKILGFTNKPIKTDEVWKDKQTRLWFNYKDSQLFRFIQWEDEEPYEIAELIREYEIKELRLAPSGTVIVDSFDESEETEVLSQEWIDEHAKEVAYDGIPDQAEIVYVDELQNLLVPKRELPVIPQWVADNIESKKRVGTRLNVAMSEFPEFRLEKELGIDKHECNELYARAWLDGYKVEEEPIYYALIKGHELSSDNLKYWHCEAYHLGRVLIGAKHPKQRCINRMTKKNWKIYGINETNADFKAVQG